MNPGLVHAARVVLAMTLFGSSGCSRLQVATAGEVGCEPKAIEISDVERAWSSESWKAACGETLYQCSALATAQAVDYSCTPLEEKATKPDKADSKTDEDEEKESDAEGSGKGAEGDDDDGGKPDDAQAGDEEAAPGDDAEAAEAEETEGPEDDEADEEEQDDGEDDGGDEGGV